MDELRAIGSRSKSKIWTQLKANVLNKPIATVIVTSRLFRCCNAS